MFSLHALSPDTLIPAQSQGVQAWDRYAYVNNNPINAADPSEGIAWLAASVIILTMIDFGWTVYDD